ncbi:MAG: hypothetical protein EWM47_09815 [Anaerolineaceae bacterium]|nr:MAG: hypothetical protein EWM47_09815 [Anaerolineaceae bacterium]
MEITGSSYEFPRGIPGTVSNNDTQHKGYVNRWTVYDTSGISKLEAQYIDDDMIREYYNGLPCQLGYVLAGKTVERETVNRIMDEEISGHNSISHIAILDAGGEGKTTALMQLVVKLIQSGKRVFFGQDAPELHIEDLKFQDNDIIVIDNANHVKNIYDFLKLATRKRVRVIFAARANEWEMQKINIDINRSIKEYKLSGFSEREKNEFAKLLSKYTQLAENEIYDIFNNESNHFLLAAMLRTMNGGINLEKIVEDIIRETKENLEGDYKDYALFILLIICLVEQAGAKMPMFLLRNICFNISDGIKLNHMNLVNIYLKKEVQGTSAYVETRHPRISELFYKSLVKFINIDLVYEEFSKADRNIRNIRIDRVADYLDIVGMVSRYIYLYYPEFSDLIDYVIDVNLDTFYGTYSNSCKLLFKTLIDIKTDAIKTMSDNVDIIDDLYAKATSKWFISGNSELWYKWAKYKTDIGTIGNVDELNSARWIYNQALLNNQIDETILIGWADLEVLQCQYGDVKNPEPYSARWIYRWAIDNQRLTENIIFNWAQMEESLNNIGDIKSEYTARWIYNWGITNNTANENLLIKWANMEIAQDNIGDVGVPYSALWIYKWGTLHNKADENLLINWAELELNQRGLGDIESEHSARWIFNWGISNNKAGENLFLKWADAELDTHINNVGDLETPYTARWIYSYALKVGKANSNLFYRWIQLEFEQANIEPAEKEYTALWLLNYVRKLRVVDRNYWSWVIGIDMELGKTEQAYSHCKEASLTCDIYDIFALVQGERGVLDDKNEGMDYLMNMALNKNTLLGIYCSYLCDLLYKGGYQAKDLLDKFNAINEDTSYLSNKSFLKFWLKKLDN